MKWIFNKTEKKKSASKYPTVENCLAQEMNNKRTYFFFLCGFRSGKFLASTLSTSCCEEADVYEWTKLS